MSLEPTGVITNSKIKDFNSNSFYNFKTWEVKSMLIDCEGNLIKLSVYTLPNLSNNI